MSPLSTNGCPQIAYRIAGWASRRVFVGRGMAVLPLTVARLIWYSVDAESEDWNPHVLVPPSCLSLRVEPATSDGYGAMAVSWTVRVSKDEQTTHVALATSAESIQRLPLNWSWRGAVAMRDHTTRRCSQTQSHGLGRLFG